MAASPTTDGGDHGFQIAPMVDIIFVLLIFFMACSGLSEKLLSVSVPGRNSNAPQEISIFIDIDAAGAVSVNGTVLSFRDDHRDLGRLREFLAAAVRTGPEDPVIIRPVPDARHEHVVAVADACRSLHVKKLRFY